MFRVAGGIAVLAFISARGARTRKAIAGSLHLRRRLRAGDLGSVRGGAPVFLSPRADPIYCGAAVSVRAFHVLLSGWR